MSEICRHDGCGAVAETGRDECFRHRVMSVGFAWRGGGGVHRQAFHDRTTAEYMREHLGTDDDRELGRRGIERSH